MKLNVESKHNLFDTVYWVYAQTIESGQIDKIEIFLGESGNLSIIYGIDNCYINEKDVFANQEDAEIALQKNKKEYLSEEIERNKENIKRFKNNLERLEKELGEIS